MCVSGRRRGGKEQEGDLVLGQVWFPLDQRPGVGLFVQAERPRGEQRQPDVAPPHPTATEGESAAALCSLSSTPPRLLPPLLSPVPFCTSLHSTHPYWNKVQKGLLNCLRMFSVYVLFMRVMSRVPVRAPGPAVLETEPCDGSVAHM